MSDFESLIVLIIGIILGKSLDIVQVRLLHRREDEVADRKHLEWIDQQWWQKKADTYAGIIDSLWSGVAYDDKALRLEFYEEKNEVWLKTLEDDWATRHKNLERQSTIGAFYISEEAAEALKTYLASMHIRQTSYWEDLQSGLAAGRACLESVKLAAVKDLRLKSSSDSGPARSKSIPLP